MKPDFGKAVETAQEIVKNLKERPIDLKRILSEQGLRIVTKRDINDCALLDPINRIIYVKDQRKNNSFEIAIALGHWFLHPRDKNYNCKSFTGNEIMDAIMPNEIQEANAFAFELLMPYAEVREFILLNRTYRFVARYFKVPYWVAVFRYDGICDMIF